MDGVEEGELVVVGEQDALQACDKASAQLRERRAGRVGEGVGAKRRGAQGGAELAGVGERRQRQIKRGLTRGTQEAGGTLRGSAPALVAPSW